jgi:hypothetical protein
LTHPLHTGTNPPDVISTSIVNFGRVVLFERQAESIDLLKRRVGAPAAPASPGRNRTGKCPTAPLLFQAITHSTTEVNFGPSDFLPLHKIDFPAIAERDVAAALVEPFEAVPLPSGSTPVKFLGKPFGRL